MTPDKFKENMAMLGEAYSREITKPMAKLYWVALKDLSDSELSEAIVAHINDPEQCQFFPQAGTLRAKISGTVKQLEVSLESRAIEAWDEAYSAMMRKGQYSSVELSDPLAMKVIQHMGGWTSFCMMKQSEEQWRRKEFIGTYKTLYGSQNLPSRLSGVGSGDRDKLESKRQLERLFDGAKKVSQ